MTIDPNTLKDAIKASWWAALLYGIVGAVIGLLLLMHPDKTLAVMAGFLGIAWVVGGSLEIGSSLMGGEGWGWRLFGGVVRMLAGLFVVAHPLFAAAVAPVTLVYVLAFAAILSGVSEIVTGRRFGSVGASWSWGSFFAGAFQVLIGILLLSNSLFTAAVMVSVVGAMSMVAGIGLVIYAFQVRGAAARAVDA